MTAGRRASARRGRALARAGFTLLEVLVALAILGLAVVAAIQAFAQGLRLLKLSGDHQQATLLADQKLREVAEPVAGREEGTEGPFRWERVVRRVETPELEAVPEPHAWRVWEITVRVAWDAGRQVELATLRTTTPRPTPATGLAPPGPPAPPGPSRPPTPGAPGAPTPPGPRPGRLPGR